MMDAQKPLVPPRTGRESNIRFIIGRCVVLVSCNHPFSGRSHSVDVSGATGLPEVERPQGRKQPAQVKSGGWPEPSDRPSCREPRPAGLRLDCLKPNPERMINGPVATVARPEFQADSVA